MMHTTGQQVKNARETAGWSRKKLAHYLDISSSALWRKESGQEKFTTSQLDTLSNLFKIPIVNYDNSVLDKDMRKDYGVPGVQGLRGLLLSILAQRVKDTRSANPKVRSEALDWIMYDDLCMEICEEFGYSVSALHRELGIQISTQHVKPVHRDESSYIQACDA